MKKEECSDPLAVLFQPCFQDDDCPEDALSETTFPFLTSKDEDPPSWGDFLLFSRWGTQVLLSVALTAFFVYDPFDIVPDPLDVSVVNYISSIAIGTYILAQYQSLTSRTFSQAAEFRNMINAVTSFGHNLAEGFTVARANKLLSSTFTLKIWDDSCTGPGKIVDAPGSVILCYLVTLTMSAIYGTTRGLDDDGINIDLLPLKFKPLYNEVKRYTSPRNQDQLSTIMEMAGRMTQLMLDEGVIDGQTRTRLRNDVGDFNTAIGNIAIAKEIKPNPWSNRFLALIIAITVSFIPLGTDFTNEWKLVSGFIIAFVFQYTLALRQVESEITEDDNTLAGIRLKDEDDPGAYAVAVAIAKIAEMGTTETTEITTPALAMLTSITFNRNHMGAMSSAKNYANFYA